MLAFWLRASIGLVATMSLAHAATELPRGCEKINFQFSAQQLILNEKGGQSLFLFHNRGVDAIELRRYPISSSFMGPSLSATLAPDNWGAFASDLPASSFSCRMVKEGKAQGKVNCAEVISVCEYPRAKFALSNMGNYWVSANKTQQAIVTDVANKGIYLRW